MNGRRREARSNLLAPGKKTNWGGCICGLAVIAFVVSIVAVILAIVAINQSSYTTTQRIYETSIELASTPYQIALTGPAPLAMTLPSDMSSFVGHRYTINSVTAQPHTVQLTATNATWDGVNTLATFGGAPGDGFSFVVVSTTVIRIEDSTNVAFS